MQLEVKNARQTEICFISDESIAKSGASFTFYYGQYLLIQDVLMGIPKSELLGIAKAYIHAARATILGSM